MSRPSLTWRMLVRRGWLLAAGAAIGIAVAWAISGVAVSATSSFGVRTVGGFQPPYQLDRLALSYAQLIPEEPEVVKTVSRVAHVSPDYVRDHLTMNAKRETNVVFARFSAPDAATALAALKGLGNALAHKSDAAGTSLRRTVEPLSAPAVTHGFSRKKGLVLGALAGLLIALSIALALEGRVPRVDDLSELGEVLPLPVSQVRREALSEIVGTAPAAVAPVRVQPLGGAAEESVLVVERGAPVAAVEDAWRASVAAGSTIGFALLLHRDSLLGRLRMAL